MLLRALLKCLIKKGNNSHLSPARASSNRRTMCIDLKIGEDGFESLLVLVLFIYMAYQINMYVLFRNIIGVLYPAYCSYKAVQYKDPRQYVRWMMYWIVLAAFSLVEIVADVTIGYIMPFYSFIKLLFIAWLSSSVTRGANILFRHLIYFQLVQHETSIDYAIRNLNVYLLYISKWMVHLSSLIRDTFETNRATAVVIENGEDHVDGSEWVDDEVINLSHDAVDAHTNDSAVASVSGKEWVDNEDLINKSQDVPKTSEDNGELTDLSPDFFYYF